VENDSTGTARSVSLDTVVSGSTTDTPSITKTGSGTLIFSGVNTATAPMIVEGGKLQLGNGGTTGSIASSSLEIGTDATVVFNINTDPITYGGVITGSGVITKRGTNSLSLTGNGTHTGLLEILEGTITLNGNIRSNIEVTAPLFGRGSTTGSLILKAGGIVYPEDSNPSRILTVGSLTMDPNSSSAAGTLFCTLVPPAFSFDGNTSSQMLKVTGSVNLNNINPKLSFLGASPAQSGFTYTMIDKTSSGPVIGTFIGLPEGAYLPTSAVSGRPTTDNNYFRISYLGGDGNDVTVRAIAATEVTPTVSNVSITSSVSGNSSSPMNVGLNFSYLPYLSNTVLLQTSTDLVNWTTYTSTFSTNASGSANINAVIIGTSQANTPKLFIRVISAQ
jgi:autotransporter-associated beta strand protein